ncbi:MAG: DUF6531 domain-containing protein, partial [Solirubrobacterales bacterium]
MLTAVLAAGLAAVALGLPAGAWASICTDTWTGASEGIWQTASNWSTGKAPSSSDVACVGTGKTVNVTEGTNQAGVLQDEGTLVISAGSLELTSALEASSAHSLTLSGGTLEGAGALDVSSSFSWTGGTMSGSGSTVLISGASGSLASGGSVFLSGRLLVNESTFTFSEGQLWMSEGGKLENAGTFNANAESGVRTGSGESVIVNTGTFQKTAGAWASSYEVFFENHGDVTVEAGSLKFYKGGSSNSAAKWVGTGGGSVQFVNGSFSLSGGSWSGAIDVTGASVTVESVTASTAQLSLTGGTVTIQAGTMTVESLSLAATLTGAGTLEVSGSFSWSSGTMSGSGSTVLASGVSESLTSESDYFLAGRILVNEGVLTLSHGQLWMSEGAKVENVGTFNANTEVPIASGGGEPLIVNTGTFAKTAGTWTTEIAPNFENLGTILEETGHFKFLHPVFLAEPSTQYGGENPSAPGQQHPSCGDPVNCATGNFSESQPDLAVGGRGVGLNLTRVYNSQAGAEEGTRGSFGYGWSGSFSDHLVVEKTNKRATLHQANGSTVPFTESSGKFTTPAWSQDTLGGNSEAGYTVGLASQMVYKFKGSNGRLESVTDRNGNATTLAYSGAGRLETITDPAGRKITLTYNSEGLVESAKDPLGHIVKYAYESGNLASVTEPGESSARWQFKYDGLHEITTMTDGRGGKTVNE